MQRAEQLDTQTINFIKPTYKLTKVNPTSDGQAFSIPVGGGIESIIEIPVKVFNLARSYLYLTLTATSSGANRGNWAWTDVVTPILKFNYIQLVEHGFVI